MATPKGKTSSIKQIETNRDLALWRDITQSKTRRYPKKLYERVIPFMENNLIFRPGDIELVEQRYKHRLEYLQMGSAARCKMLRILRDLSINRKGYVDGDFLKQKDKEVHSFEKGYWKGHKISQMSTYYLEKAREYALRTNQSMKAAELDKELKIRKGAKTMNKTTDKPLSIIDFSKLHNYNYELVKRSIKENEDKLEGQIADSGRCKMLSQDAQDFLVEYITNGRFNKQVVFTKKTESAKKEKGDDYMLKARLKLAFMIDKEENEEVKKEYFNLLKDLRKGE